MFFNLYRPALLALGVGAGLVMSAPATASPENPADTLIFAHRGASALRPEETLAAFEKAIADGADYIEPDLVPTKDGVLVARHESNIAETTDVAGHPEFAARKTVKVIDGKSQEGWFTEDFTLAELKTLRAKERLGAVRAESMSYDGKFEIATFDEIVALAARSKTTSGKPVGLIPEIKHPTYFARLGLDTTAMLVATIKAAPALQSAPLIVQCFEPTALKRLHTELAGMANVQLMQLIDTAEVKQPADVVAAKAKLTFVDMATLKGLTDVAKYAQWVGVPLRQVVTLTAEGAYGPRTAVLADSHRAGLKIAVFTFRPENKLLPYAFRNGEPDARWAPGMAHDMEKYLLSGIDGLFADDPHVARVALDGGDVDALK